MSLPGGASGPAPSEPARRGFGPADLAAMLVVLAGGALFSLLGSLLVLGWARLSSTPWRALGLVRPRRWAATIAGGIVFGAAFKLAMKSLVMPLLGAEPLNAAYRHLAGNTAALPGMLFAILVGAGFGEELLFRGFLFERLGRLLGDRVPARVAIVLLTSALFGAVHYPDQGLPGVQQAVVVGAVFGAIFARTRSLPFVMIAHAAFDLVALALIYARLEEPVARFFFG